MSDQMPLASLPDDLATLTKADLVQVATALRTELRHSQNYACDQSSMRVATLEALDRATLDIEWLKALIDRLTGEVAS